MENVKFCPLFSGSNGNCIFVSYKSTKLLIDCGCSLKKIKDYLKVIGEDIKEINAVFITHSHTDHTAALPVLLKNSNAKICATAGTLYELFNRNSDYREAMNNYNNRIFQIKENQTIKVIDMVVGAFSIPHDAPQTVGYNITADEKSLSILTDIGFLRENLFADVCGKDLIFMESNHDLLLLSNCSYPMSLKQRILGKGGHLSNDNAGILATHFAKNGVKKIILGHLSGEANTSDLALKTVSKVLLENGIIPQKDIELSVSPRGELGGVYIL